MPRGPDLFRGLTDDERGAIWIYTGWTGFAETLNLRLQQNVKFDTPLIPAIASFSQLLETALRKLPVFPGKVYRGIRLPREVLDTGVWQPRETIRWAGFVSASRQQERAFAGDALLIIESRSGRSLQTYTQDEGEEEVLFLPGSTFVITFKQRSVLSAVVGLQEI